MLVAFEVPLAPEHVNVNEYVLASSRVISSEPFNDFVPLQSPEAEQEFVLVVVQFNVIEVLIDTELAVDENVLIIGFSGADEPPLLSPDEPPPPPPHETINKVIKI